jgi:hypothetical protein
MNAPPCLEALCRTELVANPRRPESPRQPAGRRASRSAAARPRQTHPAGRSARCAGAPRSPSPDADAQRARQPARKAPGHRAPPNLIAVPATRRSPIPNEVASPPTSPLDTDVVSDAPRPVASSPAAAPWPSPTASPPPRPRRLRHPPRPVRPGPAPAAHAPNLTVAMRRWRRSPAGGCAATTGPRRRPYTGRQEIRDCHVPL